MDGRENGRGHGSGNVAFGRGKLLPFSEFSGSAFFPESTWAYVGGGENGRGHGSGNVAFGRGNYGF